MKKTLLLTSIILTTLVFAKNVKDISIAEILANNTAKKCWVLIDKNVYDITNFLTKHPAPKEILPFYCGKDITVRFQTKGIGEPHSKEAKELLKKYKIGVLKLN
jgi:cytochrome b involved in lipid metabolism